FVLKSPVGFEVPTCATRANRSRARADDGERVGRIAQCSQLRLTESKALDLIRQRFLLQRADAVWLLHSSQRLRFSKHWSFVKLLLLKLRGVSGMMPFRSSSTPQFSARSVVEKDVEVRMIKRKLRLIIRDRSSIDKLAEITDRMPRAVVSDALRVYEWVLWRQTSGLAICAMHDHENVEQLVSFVQVKGA